MKEEGKTRMEGNKKGKGRKKIRLDRFLANAHIGSRTEVKMYIKDGRVKVNGEIVYDPAFYVSEEDVVTIDDMPVEAHRFVYIMLNKPTGFVSTTSENEPSVLNLIEHPYVSELHIAGRLDKDVEGLLILTNDGEFTHRLISPKKKVEKEYYIYSKKPVTITREMEAEVERGLEVDGEKFLPGRIRQIDERTVSITIVEGKYHQIKKMCKRLGIEWEKIKRIRIGRLTLDQSLKPGAWRELTKDEVKKVFE
uniref:rRNA pseudouridine synthase n=1 Tax=Fervidobacterium pennivorans TaxID=93466 RepID=A0A7V4NH38_FERPE